MHNPTESLMGLGPCYGVTVCSIILLFLTIQDIILQESDVFFRET